VCHRGGNKDTGGNSNRGAQTTINNQLKVVAAMATESNDDSNDNE
jgi:hypothetical protein